MTCKWSVKGVTRDKVAPLPFLNRVKSYITLLVGVIIPVTNGRGPPCMYN